MKSRILWTILIIPIMFTRISAQAVVQRQKAIGGNNYDGFKVDLYSLKNGGLIVGGTSISNKSGEKTQNIRGGTDYWVVAMNEHGKIKWDRTFGGNSDETFKGVIQTSDGGYALIGESFSNISVEKGEDSRGSSDYWIVKLDKKGETQWNRTIGGSGTELIDNIVQTKDGGYILAGSSDSYRSGEKSEDSRGVFDYWVVKLDKAGNIQWDKTIGGNDYEFCSGIEITNDGGAVIAGFSQSYMSGEKSENSRGMYDYWIVKLDKAGNIQWNKTIGGNDGDFGRGIKQTRDGGYLISGISFSNMSGDKSEDNRGGSDYWIVKLDRNGNFEKDKTIGSNGNDDDVWCLEKTSDGGYIFGGNSNSNISGEKTEDSRGDFDYWVIKLDRDLNIQWDKTIGGNGYDVLYSVKEIERNTFAVAGMSWSDVSGDKSEPSRGFADYWIVWLKNTGHHYDKDPSPNSVVLKDVAVQKIFAAYPNPAKNIVNVHINGTAMLTLTDQSGRTVLTKSITGNGAISISSLPAGVYYLKNNTTSETQKIVITR